MSQSNKSLVKFTGKCLYAQVYPGQERAPHPEAVKKDPHTKHDKYYNITVECSGELFNKLLKAGISKMTELKVVEGKTYITVKAAKNKYSKTKEEMYTFRDPVVIDNNNDPLSIDTLIGNGSKVEVIAELATIDGKRKALRLRQVKVLELVPYTRPVYTGEVNLQEDYCNPYEQEEAHNQDLEPEEEDVTPDF